MYLLGLHIYIYIWACLCVLLIIAILLIFDPRSTKSDLTILPTYFMQMKETIRIRFKKKERFEREKANNS